MVRGSPPGKALKLPRRVRNALKFIRMQEWHRNTEQADEIAWAQGWVSTHWQEMTPWQYVAVLSTLLERDWRETTQEILETWYATWAAFRNRHGKWSGLKVSRHH